MPNINTYYSLGEVSRPPVITSPKFYPLGKIARSITVVSPEYYPLGKVSRVPVITPSIHLPIKISRVPIISTTFNYRNSGGATNTVAGFGVGGSTVPHLQIVDTTGTLIYASLFAVSRGSGRQNIQWACPAGVSNVRVRYVKGSASPGIAQQVVMGQPKLEIGSKATQYVPGPSVIGIVKPGNLVYATPDGSSGLGDYRALTANDIPNLAASKITSGLLALARGGTNTDLSATGGASQVLKQLTAGGSLTVAQLASTDLSDISVGSWTPVLAGQTTAGTQTYSTQTGVYVAIGNLVYVSFLIALTAFDATTAGNVNVTGLPFAVTSANPTFQYIANCYFAGVANTAGYTQFVGTLGAGNTRCSLVEIGSNVAQHRLQPSQFSSTSTVACSGLYQK